MSSGQSQDHEEQEGRYHRRGFFTEGFRNLMRPLADIVEKRIQNVDLNPWNDPHTHEAEEGEYGDFDSYPGPEPDPPILLRPPGALPEEEFLQTCTGSGQCVGSCPVSAIKPALSDDPAKDGKPVIEARFQACVLCQDLSCMKACPSGALQVLEREQIRMGTAVVKHESCVRSQGEDCQICVDKCPLGSKALDLLSCGEEIAVDEEGCVGCGVCEMSCPADPRGIVVEPHEWVD